MAFSVSFTFKAIDKYSKILATMSKATKKLEKALKDMQTVAKKSAKNLDDVVSSVSKSGNEIKKSTALVKYYSGALTRASASAAMLTGTSMSLVRVMSMMQSRFGRGSMGGSNRMLGGGFAGLLGGGGYRGRGGMGMLGGRAPLLLTGGGGTPPKPPKVPRRSAKITRGLIGEAGTALGLIGGATLAPLIASVNVARNIQAEFSNLRKVFDGTGAQFEMVKRNIVAMSQTMPMAIEDITKIATAASEAGIGFQDLSRFTNIAIKSSVAFDMASDKVGDALVKTRTQFGLNMNQLSDYTDQVNYLSNNMASNAREVLTVVQEIGNSAKTIGLNAGQTAAFASTLVDTGTKALRADGALKDLFITLSAIKTTMPKRSKLDLMRLMGVSVDSFDKSMKNNPLETMLVMFEKAKARGKQGGDLLASIFGKQYISEIQGLVNNLPKLKKALKDVGDRQKFVGSVQKEYQVRLETFNNAAQKFGNNIRVLGMIIGNNLMPFLSKMMNYLSPIIENISKWAEKNKALTTGLTIAAAAFGILTTALAALAGLVWLLKPLYDIVIVLRNAAIAQRAVAGAMALFAAGPPGWVAAALIALTVTLVALYNQFAGFRALVGAIGNAMMVGAKIIKDYYVARFEELKNNIMGCIAAMDKLISMVTGGNWNLDKIGAALGTNFDRWSASLASGINANVNGFDLNRNTTTHAIAASSLGATKHQSTSVVKIELKDPGNTVKSIDKSSVGGILGIDFVGANTGRQMRTR